MTRKAISRIDMNENQKRKRAEKIERRKREREESKARVQDILDGFEQFKKEKAASIAVADPKKAKKQVDRARTRAQEREAQVKRMTERFYDEYRFFIEKHRTDTLGICENVGLNNLSVDNWGGLNCFDCGKQVATLEDIKTAQRELVVEKAEQAAELAEKAQELVDQAAKKERIDELFEEQREAENPNYLDVSEGLGELERPEDSKEL